MGTSRSILRSCCMAAVVLALAACQTAQDQLIQEMDQSQAAGHPVLIYKVGFDSSSLRENEIKWMLALGNTGGKAITDIELTVANYNNGDILPSPDGDSRGIYAYSLTNRIPVAGILPRSMLVTDFAEPDRATQCVRIFSMEIHFSDGTTQTISDSDIDAYFAGGVDKHCRATFQGFTP